MHEAIIYPERYLKADIVAYLAVLFIHSFI